MDLTNSQKFYLLITFLAILIFSIFLQQSIFLHNDVCWLTYAASLLLKGGSYTKNFFEIAPPTILLLYTPAVFISQAFSLPSAVGVQLYVYLLGCVSLLLCFSFIKKIFLKPQDTSLALAFLITLEITFFVIPLRDFGQKEHFFFIFAMPYILMMTCRIQGLPINFKYALFIGLFSAFGFALKPYFLFLLVFLELYYFLGTQKFTKNNKWNLFFRPEICVIVGVGFVCATIILVFFRDYLTVVVPFALRWSYASIGIPWNMLLSFEYVVFCFVSCLFYIIFYKKNSHHILCSTLMIALFAFALSYIVQRSFVTYHWYPLYSINIILSILLLGSYISSRQVDKNIFYLMALIVVYYKVFLSDEYFIYKNFNNFLNGTFLLGLIAILTIVLLYFNAIPALLIITIPFIIMVIGLLVFYLAKVTIGYPFLILVVYLISALLLLSKKITKDSYNFQICMLLAILIFAFPYYCRIYMYDYDLQCKFYLRKLITLANQYSPHQSIYFFSTLVEHASIITYSESTTTAMRLAHFWMLPAMFKDEKKGKNVNNDKFFLTRMVTEDLQSHKPYLVFVDISENKPFFYYQEDNGKDFDFIPYFLTDKNFQTEWNHYQYFTTISYYDTLKNREFAVYRRLS